MNSDGGGLTVAVYARVSSEQQAEAGTVDSQLEALVQRAAEDGEELGEDQFFVDEGYSGATLVRPALERLRDLVAAGVIDRLYVHSPDRLARKYAYQVLLLEEFQRGGAEVVFVNQGLGETPEEKLLLQVQGMMAEYERAKILERGRRGKLHRARCGHISVMGQAPYGYRYVKATESGSEAYWEIVLEQAKVVRQIFQWIGQERISIHQVARRLTEAGIPTKKGIMRWHAGSVAQMLKNPAYAGTAAYGRRRSGERRKEPRVYRGAQRPPRTTFSMYEVAPEEWIHIPVAPIVSRELFNAVQEQLQENKKRRRIRRTGARNLLQGLIVCKQCGYSYCSSGRTQSSFDTNAPQRYVYYGCTGRRMKDLEGNRICWNKGVRSDLLEEAVWADVCSFLSDPQRIEQEYQRRLEQTATEDGWDSGEQVRCAVKKVKQGIERLIDSYAEGYVNKEEFEPRIRRARQRLARLEHEQKSKAEEEAQRNNLRMVIGCMQEFAETIKQGLKNVDPEGKRKIICALVKQIEVDERMIHITYRVSPKDLPKHLKKENLRNCRTMRI